ncbi:MAG TPA: CARDB domain-containing protein [Candidatus Nanoarchaeia archaeon]|nr:CARDB domain-containing protein [Candidatus Nanoarchaeia archaeon]
MKRGLVVFFIFVLAVPLASSISLRELIDRYIFSVSTSEMNLDNYTDYMIDKNGNEINDTLVIGLTANSASGNFIFVVNLFDKNGAIANETTLTLSSGINKINITFDSSLLSQNQFNYSVKIYNSTYSLKYRKDKIPTQNYSNYEEGFKILDIRDSVFNNNLQINLTINSTVNGTFESILFLSYNSSTTSIKENKSIADSVNTLTFNFDNETIKKTHYAGRFNISSVKIGKKILMADFVTNNYDFRNFASSSYLDGFSDSGYDSDGNGKFDLLLIGADVQALDESYYYSTMHLYDLFGNIVDIKNSSGYLAPGKRVLQFDINGSIIQSNKLNGPFIVKRIGLFENGTFIDSLNDAYTTGSYNFDNFDNPSLPDLYVNISVPQEYHYGISDLTINFSFRNLGNKPAFNVFTEIFDNGTFSKTNKSSILSSNSELKYQLVLKNTSDFEITALADSNGFVEESNEDNNAQKLTIKINKKPVLSRIFNLTANETDKIIINISAYDENSDIVSFSVNSSKFSNKSALFEWQTTTIDSGNYTFAATASDGYLNDSVIFNVVIIDNPEKDSDNDGLNDSLDNLIGDEKSINTSTLNLTIFLNDSGNLSRAFNGTNLVKIKDGNLTLAEFDFDFSANKLNFTNLTFNKQIGNATGSIIFSGLKLPSGYTKTLYVDRLNSALNGICIKDEDVLSVNELSGSCTSSNEFKIECDGTLQNSYSCTYNSTINKYKIKGLKHSGIIQFDYAKPSEPSSSSSSSSSLGSGGGGGGGGELCTSNWKCSDWSGCINGTFTRKCEDTNKCGFPTNSPKQSQPCTVNKQNSDENSFIRKVGNAVNNQENLNQSKIFGITGAAVKSVSANPYIGVFAVSITILFILGFYFNKKYDLLKMFK